VYSEYGSEYVLYNPWLTEPFVDTVPPSAEIIEPEDGSYVHGLITIRVEASDNIALSRIEFYINDILIFTDCGAPYEYEWNTTAYTEGTYTIKVKAYDVGENNVEASITVIIDNTPPDIGVPSISPKEPTEDQDVTVSVNVIDVMSGVAEVILSYSVDGGFTWTNVTMTATNTTYETTIPGQPIGTEVLYKIYARDAAGNWIVSDHYSYTVKAILILYVIGVAAGAAIAVAILMWVIKRSGIVEAPYLRSSPALLRLTLKHARPRGLSVVRTASELRQTTGTLKALRATGSGFKFAALAGLTFLRPSRPYLLSPLLKFAYDIPLCFMTRAQAK